jgi:signal transduction histidine kinase
VPKNASQPNQSPLPIVDRLRSSPLLAELSDDDFQRLCVTAEIRSVAAGEIVIKEASEADALYLILAGEFEITKRVGASEVVLGSRGPGELVGEAALLTDGPRSATVRALGDGQLLACSRAGFDILLATSPSARSAIFRTMIARLQSTESLLMHQQKLAALGTLAAGLAHELNNPASAIGRGADQLRTVLAEWEGLVPELAGLAFSESQVARIAAALTETNRPATMAQEAGIAATIELEDTLQAWLAAHGISDSWMLAPELASSGWTPARLTQLAAHFAPTQVPVVLQWLGLTAAAHGLIEEVRTSAKAISEIVQAVKLHTFLGQAPIQHVDVRESLEATLVILRTKLKRGIRVIRDYAADVPPVEAYGSELSQVWINLIDNAIDAMGGEGELRLRVARDDRDRVIVEIEDNGPGIPPDVQARLFEPFFTTKPPGAGTGLGLHVAYTIIAAKQRGEIAVASQPGMTRFTVTLPVRLPERPAAPPDEEE